MGIEGQGLRRSGSEFLESIERLTRWQKMAIVGGVIALFLGAAVWFLYLPKWDEIEALDERLQGLEKKLATAKINAAQLEKFQAKMQEAESKFKVATRALPEKEEIPSLLSDVSKSGLEYGIEFLSFKPEQEKPHEFYAEIPFSLSIRGDFHNMTVFFDTVARMPRIINITGLKVDPSQEGRKLNTVCNAVTYKFVEPPPEPPAAAKPAAGRPAPNPDPGKTDKKAKKPRKLDFN